MSVKEHQEKKWDRLEKNKEILNIHAITHKPVHHITNGRYERDILYETIKDLNEIIEKKKNNLLFEFPCKVGDTVAVRALCECIYTTPNNEECRNECPFEDYCDFDECDNSNEGVFLTKISSIFNNGYGWKVSFEHCCIEADIKDIGTSFFVGENAKEEAEKALKGGVE